MARKAGRGKTPREPAERPIPRPRVSEPEPVEVEVPVSAPDEIEFLPERKGRVWAPVEVDRAVRDANELLVEGDKEAGRRIWRFGDKVLELYNGYPERAKRVATFIKFATQAFSVRREVIYEALRARHRVKNVDVATELGRARIQLAFRLLALLGIETLETLKQRDLALPDEQTCRFPATVRELKAAVKLLEAGPAPKSSRKLNTEAERRNEIVRVAKAEDPTLQGVRIKYVARDGDVFLENGPLSTAQQLALAKITLQIDETA